MSMRPQTFTSAPRPAVVAKPAPVIVQESPVQEPPVHQQMVNTTALTPSQSLAADRKTFEFRDGRGRLIKWRTLSVLDQVRLMRAVGSEQSENRPYMSLVAVAAGVYEIDGRPISFPRNENQIDALIQNIDDDGFNAIDAFMRADIERAQKAADEVVAGQLDS